MRRIDRPLFIRSKVAAGGDDPYYATSLLRMHFQGANGSTAMVDSSPNAWAATAVANAQLTTSNPKFGVSAYLGDGSDDYIALPSSGLWQIAADFTVRAWIWPNTVSATRIIFSTRPSGADRGLSFYINTSGQLSFNAWDASGNAFAIMSSTSVLPTNQYTHVAVSRQGSVFRLFFNGVQENTTTDATALGPTATGRVAGDAVVAGREFDGRIGELDVNGSFAIYTGNFALPTAPLVP